MTVDHLSNLLFYPLVVIIGLVVLTVVITLLKISKPWPYRKVPLMTAVEKKFYWLLKDALPDYHIFSQVQLSQVIRPPKGRDEFKWLNKIWCMSLDYVILDQQLETLAVIELDDKTHLLKRRQEADQKKDKALKAAKVRMIRVKVSQLPTKQEIRALFNK